MRCAVTLAVALLVIAPAGCKSQGSGEETTDSESLRSTKMARVWEDRADSEIALAGHAETPIMKRRHYDVAIEDLKKARGLYEDELAEAERGSAPIPPSRRAALDTQIDRLSKAIEQTVRERPLVSGM